MTASGLHIPPPDFASWPQWRRNEWFAKANRDISARKAAQPSRPSYRAAESASAGPDKVSPVAPPEAAAPIPLRRELSPADSFPIDALGEVLGRAAHAIIDKVQCPDALAACSVLAAASLSTQAHADVVFARHGPGATAVAIYVHGGGER
jgi:hypothetical protein